MPLLSTEAFVLSTLRLGEADKLITFYTLTHGKLAGVAKGARRFKNRFGASLEPFTQCHLVAFDKGQNKLARIQQADIVHSFQKLRDDWETIVFGTRMVQLVLKMTPDAEPHPDLYHLLQKAFALLETGMDRSLSFILFVAHLIARSGYQFQWDRCVRCCSGDISIEGDGPPRVPFTREGGILCVRCRSEATGSLSREAVCFLQSVSKTDFISAHHLSVSPLARREVETLFKDHVVSILGRSITL